ncbi:MAG: hypothetical protein F6J87_18340 [Spirulina sp. SIO3F2]|nr:hypothetical protein [Spirulina sp. SIO3F2]
MSSIILTRENYPFFDEDLATLPPVEQFTSNGDRQSTHFIFAPGEMVMRPATPEELFEFIHSGEYDQRLAEIGEDDDG